MQPIRDIRPPDDKEHERKVTFLREQANILLDRITTVLKRKSQKSPTEHADDK